MSAAAIMSRREAHWWHLACVAVLVLVAYATLYFVVTLAGGFAGRGALPPALDFITYWSAGHVALEHHPAAAYDNTVIAAYERAHTTMKSPQYLTFCYPPLFLLLCLPLGLLPYLWAFFAFAALQAALLLPLMRRVLVQFGGAKLGWLPVLAMPCFIINVFAGQNAGLSASCMAGAMLLLGPRPWLGGACLGLLACKPHLALCIPVALLCAGRFRALIGAACTATAFGLLALAVFGADIWHGFLANVQLARAELEVMPLKWHFAQSLYAQIRIAGGSASVGYAAQAVLACLSIGFLARLCWRRPGAGAEVAAMAATTFLVSPYLNDYDSVISVLPVAWLAAQAVRHGFLPGEKIILAVAYLMPFALRTVSLQLGVLLSPPVMIMLLFCIQRRISETGRQLV